MWSLVKSFFNIFWVPLSPHSPHRTPRLKIDRSKIPPWLTKRDCLDWQSEIVKTGWPRKGGTRGRWHPINQTHSKCHSLSMEVYQCSFNNQNLNFEWVLQVSAKKCSSRGWFWKFVLELWVCPELNIQEPRLCAAPFLIGEGREVVWALTSNLATNWS